MNHIMNPCLVRIRLRLKLDTALKRLALPLLVLMFLPPLSFANVYKCVSDSGAVTYSDEPCGENAVVAFEKYVMGVEGAASRDIITPNTNRADFRDVLDDVCDHAKRLGSSILPDKKFINYTASYPDPSYTSNLDWRVELYFGYNRHIEWRINVFYELQVENYQSRKLRTVNNVKLKAIKITRDKKPFNPISMENLKTFQKMQDGEWQYQR